MGQQDALLPAVENRWVSFNGATTENPFFSVIGPLLSRSLLLTLEPLSDDSVREVIDRALSDERGLGGRFALAPDAAAHLVLLGLVEAVHLVDEQNGLGTGQAQLLAGLLDRRPYVLHSGRNRRQLDETPLRHLADDMGEGGLARPRRPPQHQRHGRIMINQLAERGAGAGQVLLADHLVQVARAHPHGQRRGRPGSLLTGLVEEAGGPAVIRRHATQYPG